MSEKTYLGLIETDSGERLEVYGRFKMLSKSKARTGAIRRLCKRGKATLAAGLVELTATPEKRVLP